MNFAYTYTCHGKDVSGMFFRVDKSAKPMEDSYLSIASDSKDSSG